MGRNWFIFFKKNIEQEQGNFFFKKTQRLNKGLTGKNAK